MSIDSVVSIAWDVLKCAVIPIKRQFGYMMSSKRYAQDLQKEVGKLAYEVQRVHNAIEEARNNLRNVYSQVTEWQESAEKALKEAQVLLRHFEEASKTCCYGTLPNPNCRYQFSRKAKDKIEGIRQLTRECSELKDISFSGLSPGNVASPTPAGKEGKYVIKLRDHGIFESRALIIQGIIDALADNSNSVVGVYGMGGVGKSTLLVDVERRIREDKSFDLVAKADVSENPDIKRIQGEIAHALGLNIENKKYVNVRAELLRSCLENEERTKQGNDEVSKQKKVLIILDNLWEGLDLNKVGIPCKHDNKVIGCKLLLTSRNRDILRREMRCDKDFLLGGLQEEEAKRLFGWTVGDKVHDDDFKPLVDEALHKCAGLPFLIVTMAKIFKDADLSEWKDVLKQIEVSKNEGISKVINDMLQLSYDHLKVEEAKSLLQLCVVYDISEPSIENLVRYGVGLELFGENSSMEEARNRLSSLIHTLQASSFLLENGNSGGFKVHDLVREFVASITSRDEPLLMLKDKDKDKFISKLPRDKLKNCKAICFPYIDMKDLPEELNCPKLKIFLLFMNNKSLNILDSFFNSMRKLMVLNITGISLTRLPSSFELLEDLRTLCLDGCTLDDVAILGKLKGLQILSFRNSNIRRLPQEIGQLVDLRLLDLNNCSKLRKIEPSVLGSLIKLEELYMRNSYDQWSAVNDTLSTDAGLIELNHMKKLSTLYVSIPKLSMLPEDLNVEKLIKFDIKMGNMYGIYRIAKGLRMLELGPGLGSHALQKRWIQSLLGKTDDLNLNRYDGIQQSICMLVQKDFPKLKHLHVQFSYSIHYILQSPSHIDFKSFSVLKVVQVEGCTKMEVLFPLSVARELQQLEEIEVVYCELLQGIVEAIDCDKFELRNLHVLKLRFLPSIKNFFTARIAPSSITSNNPIGTQVAFFNGQQVAFPRLETLEIKGLDNLGFLFFPSMVKSLTQLRKLIVRDCNMMEAIIVEEEGLGMEISETLAFPMLTDLYLISLESLTCFSRGKCSRKGQDQDRVKSRSIALFNREVAFPSLETLVIGGVNNIEMIWDNQVYIRHLKTLNVANCHGLSNIFTWTIAENLVELIKLRIRKCKTLTEVIVDEGGEEGCLMAFKRLKYLELDGLTRLRCFSSSGSTLMFPLLEDVIMIGCLNMKFFSKGPIEVPKLDRVQATKRIGWFWKENLNITIQNMFEVMATIAAVKKMRLSEFPGLIDKWHSELITIKPSWQLESLMVDKCPSFINAIPSRLILVLNNMKTLQVCDCELLEEIFDLEGLESGESTQVMPSIYSLDLINLPKLRQLWNKNLQQTLHFKLTIITFYKCNNLRHAFAPSMARCLSSLYRMEIKECGQMEGVIAEEEGQGSEVEKIAFQYLDKIKLERLPNLTTFLSGKNHSLECLHLCDLSIAHCPKMRSLTWQSLMETDIDTPSLFTLEEKIPRLTNIVLSHMDNLSKIWTDNSPETLTHINLHKLEVQNCKSLENLFPYWWATTLDRLHELRVESCGLQEIVASRDDTPYSTTAQVLFPKLTTLMLHDMPRLKSFCPNFPTLNWLSLQKLQVTHCDKLNMLSFSGPMNKWTQRNHEQVLSDQETHSSFEKDFPNLEGLLLVDKDIEMIQDGKFPNDIFGKPKALTLACFHDENAVFPPRFLLERFHNLKSLEVFCSSFEDIFPDEMFVDKGKHPVLENLIELKLSKLHNLRRVWREDYLVAKILQSIKKFEVWDCPKLKTIFPAMTSFQNLTELVVKNSSGLIYLVTISTVTNLLYLTRMTVIGCERMKEVVTDGNGQGKVISFGNLESLTLQHLPSLECFSSTISCSFRFPSLKYIILEECPKMKIFSKGTVSTRNPNRATLFGYSWDIELEGDLNTAIQKLSA